MNRLIKTYRVLHNQGFIPIFVDDELDSKMLVEACIEAGFLGIEYTLRRRDAHKIIPWIRKHYPDLFLLVGSTLDNDSIVRHARLRDHEQIMTLDELTDIGVDGFVSMHGFSEKTFHKFSQSHILIPAAMTLNEALRQFIAGAHFIKVLGPDLSLLRLCRSGPTFNYCPLMITGGMDIQRIPEAIQAGAVLIGSGFDLMLNNPELKSLSKKKIIDILKQYRITTTEAIDSTFPELASLRKAKDIDWLNALPHQHPFAKE
jgi:2-keto-3-deoxy-6-phosphogluconate aldolase